MPLVWGKPQTNREGPCKKGSEDPDRASARGLAWGKPQVSREGPCTPRQDPGSTPVCVRVCVCRPWPRGKPQVNQERTCRRKSRQVLDWAWARGLGWGRPQLSGDRSCRRQDLGQPLRVGTCVCQPLAWGRPQVNWEGTCRRQAPDREWASLGWGRPRLSGEGPCKRQAPDLVGASGLGDAPSQGGSLEGFNRSTQTTQNTLVEDATHIKAPAWVSHLNPPGAEVPHSSTPRIICKEGGRPGGKG